ncbi:MAG: type I-U CRISPR-associated protein Cas5/Cas6 [Gemmataceae bacterium]|nr:type I-U CRISPR-associated protein Cas5/Cas6 [Gemmataceae bacterium]
MNSSLCISLRFLDPIPQFHGLGDGGEPEWPPSPLRLFQALLSAAANRWRNSHLQNAAFSAMRWLETIQPCVRSPAISPVRFGYRMYVPNNSGDLMTAAWARGGVDTTMAAFRVEKDVRPTNLSSDAVHYLYPLPNGNCPHFELFQAAARSITHLGWGIDMVAANAAIISQADADKLPGVVWRPTSDHSGTPLRVPISGTLDALITKHKNFLNRLSHGAFQPVPPLSAFNTVHYRRASDPATRPFTAFSILKPDASGYRPFDTVRRTREVAAMVRCAAAHSVRNIGWTEDRINSFIHGHGSAKSGQSTSDDRLMFLPIPSITPLKVDNIRRVLLVSPLGSPTREIQNCLNGAELFQEGSTTPVAMLSLIPKTEKTVQNYSKSASIWSTVTPVLLPGYDDPGHLRRKLNNNPGSATQKQLLEKLNSRVFHLLKKSFLQAGFPSELVEQIQMDWREVGFRSGVDLASKYRRPENLNKFPAYHVQVRFPEPVQGPLAVGAGRYRGFGLFAADHD